MINESAGQIFPSQLEKAKPASVAGFSFLNSQRGPEKGPNMKHINYRPAKISKGKKWYVYYHYLTPEGWKKFKAYENINRIHDEDEKEEFAGKLAEAINWALKEGFNPVVNDKPIELKIWTVSQCLNYFKQKLYERGLRKRTIQSYESVLRMLNKKLSPILHKDISVIRKQHVKEILAGNDWGATTHNNNLTLIKSIFNFLIDSEIITENPARSVKPLPETITKHRYFDDTTWSKIKKTADKELLEFILFLYHTGTRPNEARQLKYEHIQGNRLFIPGVISKNKKDAFVPLSKYIQDKYKGKGFIFGTSVNYFNQKFQEVKKKLKLGKDYTLYSIKATRAVHLANDGATPYAICSFFRHSSLTVTERYLRGLGLHLNTEAAEKARDI